MILLGCAHLGLAHDQYRGLPYPPNEMFEAMLNYADDGGFQGLSASLVYVHPLAAELQREFGVGAEAGIRRAISEKSAPKARLAVLRLIALDMRLNLKTAGETDDAGRRVESVQMAFLDYGFLAPGIKVLDRPLDREAKDAFRRLYRSLDRSEVKGLSEELLAKLMPALAQGSSDDIH